MEGTGGDQNKYAHGNKHNVIHRTALCTKDSKCNEWGLTRKKNSVLYAWYSPHKITLDIVCSYRLLV